MKKYKLSLFIFRRDLRLIDNTALNNALAQSESIIPCFIFDPQQIGNNNPYKSNNAIQFMLKSLHDIEKNLNKKKATLYYFHGKPETIVKKLIKECSLDAVFVNADYTPFSIQRDKVIEDICKEYALAFESYHDALLNAPHEVTKTDGSYYSVFSAFYKKASLITVSNSQELSKGNWFTESIKIAEKKNIFDTILSKKNKSIASHGGTQEALKILKNLNLLKNYKNTRDYPSIPTSHLSAHLKFGTVSIRQVYYAIKEQLGSFHLLLKQLYWRDFFTHIALHAPHVFGNAYHKKFNNLEWNNDTVLFKLWCKGTTGFPIVDAGMREMNTTGFMHNRVRMIVASFLVKDLHINWLWGEQYFAQQLVDYDPAVNNGNWQWCASTGCDAQPYFRIFNPWLQQKKFDPECIYIKKWMPELRSFDNKVIHNWFKEDGPRIPNYPRPIINHTKETMIAKRMYVRKKTSS